MVGLQDAGDGTSEKCHVATEEDALPNVNIEISHISLLVNLHRELFQAAPGKSSDSSRIRAFHTAFAAGDVLHQRSRVMGLSESMSSHTMALCLTSTFRTSSTNLKTNTAHGPIFHCDPNPTESIKAAIPLQRLMTRTSQLLTAFPGHAVLLSVGQVAEKVSKLEVTSTSVGKVMTGLEVILRKAQEWEQHASERVKLGSALMDVSILVAHWRKLELQSWSSLMDIREERFIKLAQRHWMRLYLIIHTNATDDADWIPAQQLPPEKHLGKFSVDLTPWLWKGLKRKLSVTMRQCCDVNLNIEELTKTVDTFMLTATLGQFSERLSIVEAFANQLDVQPNPSDEGNVRQWIVARMLHSVRSYYEQFKSFLEEKKQELRRPIEKKLKDEVKLAKWDEQTYYALADATERNHRKLMKCLREYDDVLDQPVSIILEKHQCSGIRATESLGNELNTKIPTFKSMFPSCETDTFDGSIVIPLAIETAMVSNHYGVPATEYIQRLDHYQRKLQEIVVGQQDNSWARFGAISASELCSDIFDRLESLRRDKTTKPMKARALVDLFRTLKRNGYKNTKWSVPEQQRQIVNLFHLPPLDIDSVDDDVRTVLASGRDYFQKCVAEIIRLRSEVSLLGSQFLSHREIQLMLHLSEHGLLMISQQKSVLAETLCGAKQLAGGLESLMCIKGPLPLRQTELVKQCSSFNERISCAAENLDQLRLLLSASLPVIETAEKRAAVHDTIASVETMVVCLMPFVARKQTTVITRDHLDHIAKGIIGVSGVLEELNVLRESFRAKSILPEGIFDKCSEQLQLAVSSGHACVITSVTQDANEIEVDTFLRSASSTVEKALLAIQNVCKVKATHLTIKREDEDVEETDDRKLWDCHTIACHELDAFNIAGLGLSFDNIVKELQQIHSNENFNQEERDHMVSIAKDVSTFLDNVLEFSKTRIVDYISFFRASTKLQYILLRVFRTLVAKGYCSSDSAEEDCDDGEGGDITGMNFEDDVEGTGMGEGDGKNDVTDQLENEEQLLGLKNDEQNEAEEKKKESKQLNEEEAKQGMEMEADFEGELCDVPDDLKDDDNESNGNDEELDREMGDGQDPNEEVVDEKMWGDSDDEDDVNKAEEKFEKDSGIKGDMVEDEMRTKDDEENDEKGEAENRSGEEKDESKAGKEGDDIPRNEGEDDINEDFEDNYEEQHQGVDVRDEACEQEKEEELMELDDINLDGGDDAEEQGGGDLNVEQVGEGDVDDDEGKDNDDDDDLGEIANDEDPDGEAEANEEAEDAGATQSGSNDDKENPMEEGDQEDPNEPESISLDQPHRQQPAQESFGVKSIDGADNVKEQPSEHEHNKKENGQGGDDEPGDGNDDSSPQDVSSGSTGGNGQGGAQEQGKGNEALDALQSPNPFKSPGDATKFWHRKLKVVENQEDGGEDRTDDEISNGQDNGDANGEFEFSASNQESTSQVLGETMEEEAVHVDEEGERKQSEEPDSHVESKEQNPREVASSQKQRSSKPTGNPKPMSDPIEDNVDENDDSCEVQEQTEIEEGETVDEEITPSGELDNTRNGNQVVSDMSQLRVRDDDENVDCAPTSISTENAMTTVSQEEALAARQMWLRIQGETHSHARRLCEKLRLVMEPLVATKLRGDYRTGKRINMKRVIGYIASGYRKDKIWLRRTKPAKRNYRVLLAVDNSESMLKSGAGNMALQAMATLALGMSQLEIGELGVASFGQDMRLLHPFHTPFTSESGSNMVQNFRFDEPRTRTALCVESALQALEAQGGIESMQLIFIISDGRIERDSRANLRRLMREMVEKNILLVMIIVEPGSNKNDSIVKMKEVKFEKGKPIVKQFMDDYPFPYYLVLEDMHQLPEVLGDALRQWFEMISQIQK